MAIFSSLSDKLKKVFAGITQRGKLSEADIKKAMREIRVALLEADVNYTVVKDFVAKVSQLAQGEEIIKSLTPGQMVVKVVNDELVQLMGGTNAKIEVSSKPPTILMMVGLQGAGKTTMCGKLAKYLQKDGKKVVLVACDIYRPAAIKQLQVVGKNAGVEVFERGQANPINTAVEGISYGISKGYDTVILDTAGRLHINEELMTELSDIKEIVQPTEILLTVDAMTGQDAANVANSFNQRLDISGVIITKLDGDTRGGAALSIRAVTGKPIKLCGVGEKLTDLELFHPERMASRILGMGDILTIVERAQEALGQEEMERLEKKFLESAFTLEDFLVQMKQISKMGDLSQLAGMLPSNMKINPNEFNENRINKYRAIIESMTKEERINPAIIKASRRKRIAGGSASTVQDVNTLLKQYAQIKDMTRAASAGRDLDINQMVRKHKKVKIKRFR